MLVWKKYSKHVTSGKYKKEKEKLMWLVALTATIQRVKNYITKTYLLLGFNQVFFSVTGMSNHGIAKHSESNLLVSAKQKLIVCHVELIKNAV